MIEGRDIGSVVFPDAALKVYLDARPEVRAARRSKEVSDLDYETVAADIARRDALDQGREASPLTRAGDAIEVDTSDLDIDEIVGPHREGPARRWVTTAPTRSAGRRRGPSGCCTGSCRDIIVGFCRLFWRLEVHGQEHVPAGPFILSAVHRSNIDSPLVAAVTRRRIRFMGKHTMWKYDLPGRFFTAMGGLRRQP